VQFHRSGNLRRAELLYREILQIDPLYPEALHLLGVIAVQVGRHESAIELIRRAIRARPE
jgi:Tfp pilus assembly protein PilF